MSHHFFLFFFNDPAPTEISPLPLHDALPIWRRGAGGGPAGGRSAVAGLGPGWQGPAGEFGGGGPDRPCREAGGAWRSGEDTSEIQSPFNFVLRLLLGKKKRAKCVN